MLGGKILYDTLCANLPIPTASTLTVAINSETSPIVEGVLRINELMTFLNKRNLPHCVWLSEDATKITTKIQYDHSTNQMVGFVLPTNRNSMPKCYSFPAKSAKGMEESFKKEKRSSLLYVYMAQAMSRQSPFFCLCAFGTDNGFKAEDSAKRLMYITKN